MKNWKLKEVTWIVAASALLLMVAQTSAQSTERFYYWVTPYPSAESANRYESFVIELDAAKKAEFDPVFARGPVFFDGQIAAGPAPYNKNYYVPGQPVWNWHFASIGNFYPVDQYPLGCISTLDPNCNAHPSEIAANPAQWIADHGTYYFPTKYVILGRAIDPSKKDALANVSNRGMTGAGEKTLITGLIITGGEPRNVVVRALGPSLSARGVQQVAANPRLEVYRGSSRLASNTDWGTHPRASRLAEAFPGLVPEDGKEAAIWLTLTPGAYTLHGINEMAPRAWCSWRRSTWTWRGSSRGERGHGVHHWARGRPAAHGHAEACPSGGTGFRASLRN